MRGISATLLNERDGPAADGFGGASHVEAGVGGPPVVPHPANVLEVGLKARDFRSQEWTLKAIRFTIAWIVLGLTTTFGFNLIISGG